MSVAIFDEQIAERLGISIGVLYGRDPDQQPAQDVTAEQYLSTLQRVKEVFQEAEDRVAVDNASAVCILQSVPGIEKIVAPLRMDAFHHIHGLSRSYELEPLVSDLQQQYAGRHFVGLRFLSVLVPGLKKALGEIVYRGKLIGIVKDSESHNSVIYGLEGQEYIVQETLLAYQRNNLYVFLEQASSTEGRVTAQIDTLVLRQ
ncbi:hypothetical protein HY491_01350 [Candidatus Woesearchaeota archaeon]|nr:hypothetical protein [Candidatus Woesearchaeota archaeon]